MSVGRADIFGSGTAPEPATPGSYGQAPSGEPLPAEIRLGPVTIQVAELDRSVAFYTHVLGLTRLLPVGDETVLGAADGTPLVILRVRPGARPAGRRGQTGLFHFAILLPSRSDLGRFVRHLGDIGVQAGAGDHLVSEAFYLSDPDGLGIEVYADRPRETWQRLGRQLMMATDPVDVAALLVEAGGRPWAGMPAGTVMGHLHLHVGDLAGAGTFYGDLLGFDRIVWSYPGALFFGAGGYHHHLGTNIWAGRGAPPPGENDVQLLSWSIRFPDDDSRQRALDRLRGGGAELVAVDGGIMVRDPWGTGLMLRAD